MSRENLDAGEFAEDVRNQTSSYLLQGMALTAALGFNTAIKATINHYYPYDKETLSAKWMYAMVIVILLILAVYIIGRPSVKPGEIVAAATPVGVGR